jgi:ribonuclease BN (tRNA processing enzyme)
MRITLGRSSVAPPGWGWQFLTTYLINNAIAIDAGSLGLIGDLETQACVTDVVLTHAHLDHHATLPVFLDNVYRMRPEPVTVHASEATLEVLRRDVFTERTWMDLDTMLESKPPFLRIATLEAGRCLEIAGLRITPFPANHVVPSFGLIVEEPGAAVAFSSDTGPTEELWVRANAVPDLKAVFLEASMPDSLAHVAHRAKHLTPAGFAREVAKLNRPATVVAVHIKPRFFEEVAQELEELNLPDLVIGQAGQVFDL